MSRPEDEGPVFLAAVTPLFARADETALTAHLLAHWRTEALTRLLIDDDANVVMTAAMSLGLIGEMAHTPDLARCLHHADYFVVTRAEQALWSIWFRASTPECGEWLRAAVTAMQSGRYEEAERLLDRILVVDPGFAEACNQRAILHFLTERFASSVMACLRTLALNPHHFGAAAGLGHNRFQLGGYDEAEAAYRRALYLHPRMEGVRQQLRRVRDARKTATPAPTPPLPCDITLPFHQPGSPLPPR